MNDLLKTLGIDHVNSGATTGITGGWLKTRGEKRVSVSPINGQPIAEIVQASEDDYEAVVATAQAAFERWRMMPAPRRGEVVRAMGDRLREFKVPLGELITLEMGKIRAESEGEIQEMIDMADFAVGLSRQLYGLTMASERPRHRMFEQWHPLGIVGIITAFNFPVAVWSWNALVSAVCGDICLWKPSSKTPLTSIAVQNIIAPVADAFDLDGVFNMIIGRGTDVGERLINDPRIALVSATGSCKMGQHVGTAVARRYGRSLLELGGNNAVIVSADADLDLATRAVVFGAVGTTGQRCTSTRRLIVHQTQKAPMLDALAKAYAQVTIGDPSQKGVLMGPLVDGSAVEEMLTAVETAKSQGGKVIYGGQGVDAVAGGFYVQPTLIEISADAPIVAQETFAPILYVMEYETLEQAMAIHNQVPQGLSSSIFTESLRTAETFLSQAGSDCGIANVNIGTSGAEIGGAFGGEKQTGGGREAGSDAWRAYMRRQTCTVNWGGELPLAQGIKFDV